MKKMFLVCAFVLLLAGFSYAQEEGDQGMPPQGQEGQGRMGMMDGQGGNGQRHHRMPPQAAIDACSGKSENAACTFTGRRGTKSGTCVYTPDKKYFVCRPSDMEKMRERRQGGEEQESQGQEHNEPPSDSGVLQSK